eukprot:TRINITY_DN10119_c0_g1_i2.p1 TRINITY_DN10119_c0_g1~~TRINITY_DN10119_c0_g1_i2.p1  ORF type:complete len:608 (-),score=45.69 TRINITY_DN10119_c0_g1_i2:74-1729(-)
MSLYCGSLPGCARSRSHNAYVPQKSKLSILFQRNIVRQKTTGYNCGIFRKPLSTQNVLKLESQLWGKCVIGGKRVRGKKQPFRRYCRKLEENQLEQQPNQSQHQQQQQQQAITYTFTDQSNGVPGQQSVADTIASTITSVSQRLGTRRRWVIVTLCFAAFMLCNMDRVNMSIAILPMAKQFAWDSTIIGLVQSSFFWGYLLTQILGGVWADQFGGKRVLGFGVVWWSIATVLTPIAAIAGLPALLLCRACMGIGEGVAMPAMNNMLSRWIPRSERSRALALVYSGMYTGSMVGLAVSPHFIQYFAWPSVFYIFGMLGSVWYGFWRYQAVSTPSEDKRISQKELDYILSDVAYTKTTTAKVEIPWGRLLSRSEVWAIILSHFCHNWGTFILLTWMPTYYNQVLHMDLASSGFYSVLPWVTMALFANIGGWIADTLVSKGMSVTLVRKLMQSIGFLGPAFFLTQLGRVSTPMQAVLCMMASQGLDSFSQSGLYSNHQDIGPRYAGVLLGMSNTAGVLAGVIGTFVTGYILKYAGWDQVWAVAVALYLIGRAHV